MGNGKRNPTHAYGVIGFLAGAFSSLCGIGGGCILMPLLTGLMRLEPRRAAGCSLATIVPIVHTASIAHLVVSPAAVSWSDIALFLPFCMAGALVAAPFIGRFRGNRLRVAFGVFLALVSLRLLGLLPLNVVWEACIQERWMALWVALFGGACGIVSSLLGVGCGLIMVPFFVVCLDIPMPEAVTSSLVCMVPLTLMGALLHGRLKLLDASALRRLVPAASLGALAGTLVWVKLPVPTLRVIFGAFALAMAAKQILRGLPSKKTAQQETGG